MVTSTATSRQQAAYDVAAATPDPELPMLSIADLGILRGIERVAGKLVVTITPTYSGCPAMREIAADIAHRLTGAGFDHVEVQFQLAPAWTSEWITEAGSRKLKAAGIAPPSAGRLPAPADPIPLTLTPRTQPACPRCGSSSTQVTARFSSTACKSLHRCSSCEEPFEAVKTI